MNGVDETGERGLIGLVANMPFGDPQQPGMAESAGTASHAEMAHGGKREGAGRKPGSVSKLDAEARRKAIEGGPTPLDFLLEIMRDENQEARARLDAAKAAAPYCHARLSATEVSGPGGSAVAVRTTQILDISDFTEEELDVLERALRKSIASHEPANLTAGRYRERRGKNFV